jgi:hypothetical protein
MSIQMFIFMMREARIMVCQETLSVSEAFEMQFPGLEGRTPAFVEFFLRVAREVGAHQDAQDASLDVRAKVAICSRMMRAGKRLA